MPMRRGNAVFLLLGKENTPVGAELRGTGPRSDLQQWRRHLIRAHWLLEALETGLPSRRDSPSVYRSARFGRFWRAHPTVPGGRRIAVRPKGAHRSILQLVTTSRRRSALAHPLAWWRAGRFA